jgi:hypothetical protein
VTAFGVAAVAALEMVGSGEDEIGAFVIKVFGEEFAGCGLLGVGAEWVCDELGGVLHC